MRRATLKTSTIFIAKGKQTRVYYSVGDIPGDLRKELEESTNGFNSATILIADRRGREELLRRGLTGIPSGLRSRLTASLAPTGSGTTAMVAPPRRLAAIPVKWWLALAGVAVPGAAAAAWFLLQNQ